MGRSNQCGAKPGSLRANIRRWGWLRGLFSSIVTRAARYSGVHIHTVQACLLTENPQYPAAFSEFTFRQIQPAELLKASEDPELDLSRSFVRAAIDRGDLAFGAFAGNELAGYVWRALGSAPHIEGLWVKVDKPYNYTYKAFVHPNYRGRRISPVLHLFSDVAMIGHNYKYRVGFVAVNNFSSLQACKHMGCETIGYAGYLHWFGRYFPFRTRAAGKIGFEFYELFRSASVKDNNELRHSAVADSAGDIK